MDTETLTLARKYADKVIKGQGAIKGEKGDPGTNGKSAYEQAVEGGYTGTEAEFNASFKDISMSKAEMLNILRGGDNA